MENWLIFFKEFEKIKLICHEIINETYNVSIDELFLEIKEDHVKVEWFEIDIYELRIFQQTKIINVLEIGKKINGTHI